MLGRSVTQFIAEKMKKYVNYTKCHIRHNTLGCFGVVLGFMHQEIVKYSHFSILRDGAIGLFGDVPDHWNGSKGMSDGIPTLWNGI